MHASVCSWHHHYLPQHLFTRHSIFVQALPASVPIEHEHSVFEWPWQLGRLIKLHEQEVLRGQQDVPWLRRRGSKNSRKLLYSVEWAQECKMSAFFFFSLGLCRITLEATGFEDNVTPPHLLIHMWHCAGKRMFVVTHLHILLWQLWRFHWRNKPPPSAVIQATDTDVHDMVTATAAW